MDGRIRRKQVKQEDSQEKRKESLEVSVEIKGGGTSKHD